MRLTAATIRALRLPKGVRDKVFFDADLKGFGLRVRGTGVQTWMAQYALGGRTRRVSLGSPATVDVGKAREAAKRILAEAKLGRDPAADRRTARAHAADTFGALLPRFLERQRVRQKPRSFVETLRHLEKHARPLHPLPVTSIDRRTIAVRLSEIADERGPVAANRTRASLSAFCTWLAREGYTDANVVSFTNRAVERGARAHVPSDRDLAAILCALGDDQYSQIVWLLAFTAARRDEIGSLQWSEVDLDAGQIVLPPERMKSRREHTIILSEPALAILRSLPQRTEADHTPRDHIFGNGAGRGYQGWSRNKANLDARIGSAVAPWRLHDFRRAFSSWAHESGAQPHIIESVLAHVSGPTRSGASGHYNYATYLPERTRLLALWGDHLTAITTGKSAKRKVVELRRRHKSR
jgi:integrase